MSLKHNKKKNGKIVYEQLMMLATRLARTKHIKESSFVLNFVKEHFGSKTMLGKEKKLFDSLLESKTSDDEYAKSVLEETLNELSSINQKKLELEKVNLINEVMKNFGRDVFNIPVEGYKLFSSIQILFNETKNNFKYSTPKERLKIRSVLLENMKLVDQEEDFEMDNFTFNILVNKFNEKYSSLMNEDQKDILTNWIDYLLTEDSNKFLGFLQEKIRMARSEIDFALIKETHLKSDYSEMLLGAREKLLDVPKRVDEENVHQIMQYFDLIEELREIEHGE